MKTHKLIQPSGVVVEVNDASLEYALSLGWKKEEKKPAKKVQKLTKKQDE